jgi:hypothetical protein
VVSVIGADLRALCRASRGLTSFLASLELGFYDKTKTNTLAGAPAHAWNGMHASVIGVMPWHMLCHVLAAGGLLK